MLNKKRIRESSLFFSYVVTAVLLHSPLPAQEVAITRASSPVVIDGRLDEEEWRGAGSITSFTQMQ